MTATVGAGSQETLAAPPVPATAAQPRAEEAERQRQLLQALTTEHFTLQTARAATIADSNGRSALYLATVSSAVSRWRSSARSPTSAERFTCSRWRCCRRWWCWAS